LSIIEDPLKSLIGSVEISLRESLAFRREIVYSQLLMYQITVTNRTHTAEAANAALVSPCQRSFDSKLRPGAVLALAGRCTR